MVVTKPWLLAHIDAVRVGKTGPLWVALPPMLVLPESEGEELRQYVDSAVGQGQAGLEMFSTSVETE
jgi:hypothetical protein